jgi:hypothetical protein
VPGHPLLFFVEVKVSIDYNPIICYIYYTICNEIIKQISLIGLKYYLMDATNSRVGKIGMVIDSSDIKVRIGRPIDWQLCLMAGIQQVNWCVTVVIMFGV